MDINKKYTRETIPMQDLPEGIKAYLDKHFSSDVVFGIIKQEVNNVVFFVLDVDHNGVLHHLKFDADGNYISEKNEITPETDEEHFVTIGGNG